MKSVFRRRISMEAMRYRFDDVFISTCNAGFQALKETEDYSKKSIEKTNIEKAVFDATGITIDLCIEKVPAINAYTIPPDLSKNHSLFEDFRRSIASEADAKKFLKNEKANEIMGMVDPVSGKVSGDFSKLVSKVVIFSGAIEHKDLTPERLTAILAHEVGHSWSYYFNLGRYFTTNLALEAAAKAFVGTDDIKERTVIIKKSAEILKTNPKDYEEILAGKVDKEVLSAVILGGSLENPQSLIGSALHDMTSWEQLSDQFVARLGLGKELGEALTVLGRATGDPSTMSAPVWFLINTLASVAIGFYTPVIVPLLLLFGVHPEANLYDNLPKRLARIRQDMVSQLKNSNMPAADSKQLLEGIDKIDSLAMDLKERVLFIERVWTLCISPWRTQKQIMERQKLLESLMSNELYVHSAKFKSLSLSDASGAEAIIPTQEELDPVELALESLDKSFSLAEAADALKNAGIEGVPALEGGAMDVLKSIVESIKKLLSWIIGFFVKDAPQSAAVETTKIEKSLEKVKPVSTETVENSDTILEELEVPVTATAFDPTAAPKTNELMGKLEDIIKKISNEFFLKRTGGDIDKMLTTIDGMEKDELAKTITSLENPLVSVQQNTKLLLDVAKELDLEVSEPDANNYSNLEASKLLVKVLGAITSPNAKVGKKCDKNKIANMNIDQVRRIANDTTAGISTMNAKEKDIKSEMVNVDKAQKKLEGMSGSDSSVTYLRRYLEIEKQVITISTRATKVMLVRLKGQRKVVNAIEFADKH